MEEAEAGEGEEEGCLCHVYSVPSTDLEDRYFLILPTAFQRIRQYPCKGQENEDQKVK